MHATETESLPEQESPYWPLYQRLLFRFWGIYFIVYFLLSGFHFLWSTPVGVMANLFGVKDKLETNGMGSGDGIYYYLQIPVMLLATLLISMVWSVADRRRKSYNKAFYAVWVIVRYILGFYLVVYGISKVYQSQFPVPTLHRLVQPYGMSSPMGLAWTFMGASRGFSMFTGWAELLAGIFLLFRQTARLGALQSIVVMSVVVAMNFGYDIPVKIFSTHLLLASVFVIAPELPRLCMFLFTGRAIPASKLYMFPLSEVRMKIAWITVKPLTVLLIIIAVMNMQRHDGSMSKKKDNIPLYGLYTAEWVVHNNDTTAAQLTDSSRWHYFIMQYENMATVRYMNEGFEYFDARTDTVNKTIALKGNDEQERQYHYYKRDDLLVLERDTDADTTKIVLRQYDEKKFLLTNRGFHWVNEMPFNR